MCIRQRSRHSSTLFFSPLFISSIWRLGKEKHCFPCFLNSTGWFLWGGRCARCSGHSLLGSLRIVFSQLASRAGRLFNDAGVCARLTGSACYGLARGWQVERLHLASEQLSSAVALIYCSWIAWAMTRPLFQVLHLLYNAYFPQGGLT